MRDKLPKILHCATCGSWASFTRSPSNSTPGYPYLYTMQCANVQCLCDSVSTLGRNQTIEVWNEKQRRINKVVGRRSVSFYSHKYTSRKQGRDLDDEFASLLSSIKGEK